MTKAAVVHALCIAPERGVLKREVAAADFIAGWGLAGDGHGGDWGRQVTCLDWESVLRSNAAHGLTMGPGDFAENVTIEGFAALELRPGERFRLGETVVLEVTQIGKPQVDSVVTRTFGVSLLPEIGRFCRVITGGTVRPGDPVVRLAD